METYLLIAFGVCVMVGFLLMWMHARVLQRRVLVLQEALVENLPIISRDMRYLLEGLQEARSELNLPQTWHEAGRHSLH